jgi:hypothetical protein
MIDEEENVHLIRAAEDLAYIEQPEKMPAHLKTISL